MQVKECTLTETEELIIYGNAMFSINEQGIREHIPRCLWDLKFKCCLERKISDKI